MRDIIKTQVADHLKSKVLPWQKKWADWVLGQVECYDWHCEVNFGFGCDNNNFGARRDESGSSESFAETEVSVVAQVLPWRHKNKKEVRKADKKGSIAENKPDIELRIPGRLRTPKKDGDKTLENPESYQGIEWRKAEGNRYRVVLQEIRRVNRKRVQDNCLSSLEIFEGIICFNEG